MALYEFIARHPDGRLKTYQADGSELQSPEDVKAWCEKNLRNLTFIQAERVTIQKPATGPVPPDAYEFGARIATLKEVGLIKPERKPLWQRPESLRKIVAVPAMPPANSIEAMKRLIEMT